MSTVLKHGLIYTGSEKIVDGYLRFDKQIINVGPMSEYKAQVSDDKIIDLEGQVVVPGFIDVHSHGGYSFDSMDGDANQIDEKVNDMVHEGITIKDLNQKGISKLQMSMLSLIGMNYQKA